MEQLMREIREYADRRGVKPATVLQLAAGLSGKTWAKWEAGAASCTFQTAERVRAYIEDNPVPEGAERKDRVA